MHDHMVKFRLNRSTNDALPFVVVWAEDVLDVLRKGYDALAQAHGK